MTEQIRIYQQEKITIISLMRNKTYTVGTSKKADFKLQDTSIGEVMVSFFYMKSEWRVRCKGNVLRDKKPIRESEVLDGNWFIIDEKKHIGIEFMECNDQIVGRVHLQGFNQLAIGKADGNDIQLKKRQISKQHAGLYKRNEDWVIRDLNSTNGTFVNGELIREQILTVGDKERLESTGMNRYRV